MRRTLQGRHNRYEVQDGQEPAPDCVRLTFGDVHEAATLLRRLLTDMASDAMLRALLVEVTLDSCSSNLGQHEVVTRLARLLVTGQVRVHRRGPKVFAAPGSPDDADKKQEKPPSLEEQKYWIHFQLLDDETGEPVPGVTAKLKLPTGEIKMVTSDGEGRVRVRGLPSGSWDLEKMECSDVLEVIE